MCCFVWEGLGKKLQDKTDSIVFIDESGRFTKSTDFANAIQHTNNYYVIVSREKLSALPYSIKEIYGIRENGKYMGLKTQYTLNEFYHIYGQQPQKKFKPEVIITEDSNSGYDFYSAFYSNFIVLSFNLRYTKDTITNCLISNCAISN